MYSCDNISLTSSQNEKYSRQNLYEKNQKISFMFITVLPGGTRWHNLLRHCATIRKVAGSIPDSVTGIFHLHNPSGRTMALGLTQPLTEMSTRNISCGVKAVGA